MGKKRKPQPSATSPGKRDRATLPPPGPHSASAGASVARARSSGAGASASSASGGADDVAYGGGASAGAYSADAASGGGVSAGAYFADAASGCGASAGAYSVEAAPRPAGPAHPAGPACAPGLARPAGPACAPGLARPAGVPGLARAPGPAGAAGAAGSYSADDDPGPAGAAGTAGAYSAAADPGPAGPAAPDPGPAGAAAAAAADPGPAGAAADPGGVEEQSLQPGSPSDEGPSGPPKGRKRHMRERERRQYSIEEEHEDEVLEWLRENEYLWRKGHRMYRDTKRKQAVWRERAESMGYTSEVLLGWLTWYGKLHLKKSGQAAVMLTDREIYVMAKCSFLEGEIRHRGAAHLSTLSLWQPAERQSSSSRESAPVSKQVSVEHATMENPLTAVIPMAEHLEDSLAQWEKGDSTSTTVQPASTPSSTSKERQRARQQEGQSHTVLLEIRDTIRSNIEFLSQLVHIDSSSSNCKPFLTYVNQTLTDMAEP